MAKLAMRSLLYLVLCDKFAIIKDWNMTNSMTAFARVELKNLHWEIRTVNQRYLDVTFRMPDSCRSIEMKLKSILRGSLHRGKVDCSLRVDREAGTPGFDIDEGLVQSLMAARRRIDEISGATQTIDSLEVLRWPGVLTEFGNNKEDELEDVVNAFKKTVKSLVEMRGREGTELKRIIELQLSALSEIVGKIRNEAPRIAEQQRLKLFARLEQFDIDADDNRLEQELVFLAQKSDIIEELDRLDTHISEVKHTLGQKGAMGRRLDFLMQELNREANTVSSKASISDTSLQAVDLKVIIEQMREQVQNIE